jgi:hypothetical protein
MRHVVTRLLVASALWGLAAAPASGQLTDLQPGRNFPTAALAFGGSSSSDIAVGDIDNDGDLEVVIANGGNGGNQQNRIYINDGGLQGGVTGVFVDGTAGRFAGVPLDASRDVDFVDIDSDGDLDLYFANKGGGIQGQVSRNYVNQGGLQGGSAGFFVEGTDSFWGTLISVAPSAETGVVDGQGPWRTWSCDCDFGDLDDDGDLDLFSSSYGPNLVGNEPSRVFLNNGSGQFDELWPWLSAGGNTNLITLDIDLIDLDDDYDLDVFGSSRDSQSRLYRNELAETGWSGDAFTDVTQTALLDTGAAQLGSNVYGADYADIDGDGDFDILANSYQGFTNRVLRNDGGLQFVRDNAYIQSDPSVDDNEPDFLDYDGDGDLDAFVTGFGPGTNYIFTSGVAQGLTAVEGYLHRNGISSGGALAPWNEVPEVGNGGSTWDSCVGDLDGDPDALIANENNQQNRVWMNELGIPDTFAPTFRSVTVQADKADGSETVIHAAIRDNSTYYIVGFYDTRLHYSVDGGPDNCVSMTSSGSQVFRGVIPGAANGVVSYHVEVTDSAGNTGTSATTVYTQTSSSVTAWQTLGCGTQGVYGVPDLSGSGALIAGNDVRLLFTKAAPSATTGLFISLSSTPLPFKGGTLYTIPIAELLFLSTDDGGVMLLDLTVPPGLPPGTQVWWQVAAADATATGGVSVSNALISTAP